MKFGMNKSFLFIGIFCLLALTLIAQFLKNPRDYKPLRSLRAEQRTGSNWRQLFRTLSFYKLWGMYIIASSAGLLLMGSLSSIAEQQLHLGNGFLFVILMGLSNGTGRLTIGMISDKIGVYWSYRIILVVQGLNFLFFSHYNTAPTFILGTVIAGICYGGAVALVPVAAAEFGTQHLGENYAILNTGNGVGAVIGPIISSCLLDVTGSYETTYTVFSVALFAMMVFSFLQSSKLTLQKNIP